MVNQYEAADSRPLVRVVAGVVLNENGEYLLSSRPQGKPYAGYWEFAGGKVEPGESELAALKREFAEELGIEIIHAVPWLVKVYSYEHAHVHLRFFNVVAENWRGQLQAREGQQWRWQKAGDFTVSPMLPANGSLLKALSVPRELNGSLATGFYGENSMGEYRVVPFDLAEPNHRNILFNQKNINMLTKLPKIESVWLMVSKQVEFTRSQDADVLVWQVSDDPSAAELLVVLDEGVPVPLVVLADEQLCHLEQEKWLAAGAHAVVVDAGVGIV